MASDAAPPHRTARSTARHPAPARGRVPLGTLWFGLAGGPVAWTLQTLVGVPVASHGCFPRLFPLSAPVIGGLRPMLIVVSLLALALCVAAATTAWRAWRRTHEEHHRTTPGAETSMESLLEAGEGRTRFMALAGVLTSLTFLLLVIAQAATILLLDSPCGV